jgi:signal peptidase I
MNASTHIRRAWRVASTVVLLAITLVAVGIVVPGLFGFERYVVTGGSMNGSIDRGSVVFAKPAPVSELKRGDVITYEGPKGEAPAGKITHRIHSIDHSRSGGAVLRTKGDANGSPDPWTFTLDRATQPRAEFHVPRVGLALIALQDRTVRMLALGLPALLVALSVLAGLWREAGTEPRREETGAEVAA